MDVMMSCAIGAATLGVGVGSYIFNRAKKEVYLKEEYKSYEEVLDALKFYMVDQVKEEPITSVLSDEELARADKRRATINQAYADAPNGVRSAKVLVKGIIRTWVKDVISIEKRKELLGLDEDGEPSHNMMFECIMLMYQQKYGAYAFSEWMKKYGFYESKPAVGIARKNAVAYYITPAEFENAYFNENFVFTESDITDLFVTKLFSDYMGWGPLDTLSEMKINGYNLGVSGPLMDENIKDTAGNENAVSTSLNSLWVYYKSNYIHMQFLEFRSIAEIQRIIQLLIRWGNTGPMTRKQSYKINTMHDRSRILAMRPDAGETWAAFVRKLDLDIKSPEEMIIKEGVIGGEICAKLIEFLMQGQVTVGFTGRQGAGKTTFLKAEVGHLPPEWNLRVLELAQELYLKETYPNREIFEAHETDVLTMEALQDAFKKSDAMITIIGEVATDPVSARMIQLAMTGSLATYFTHHANTAKDLVLTLRNSLINAGGFTNSGTAEKQVTDVLKLNIHLGFENGKRFIKRITEIKQTQEGLSYPEFDPSNPELSNYNLKREYYYRQTDRISFTTHDILTYDLETDTYKPGEQLSDYLYKRLCKAMTKEDRCSFEQFYSYYWKGESIDGYTGIPLSASEVSKEEEDRMVYSFDDAMNFIKNQ